MIRSRHVWLVFSVLFGLEGILAGQGTLERGFGTSRAATSTAPARGLKKSVGGVVGNLEKVLKTGQEASDTTSTATEVAEPGEQRATWVAPNPAPAVPAKIYEDPSGIRTGMATEELVRRFGPPALEVTGASSARTVSYWGKNGVVQLELRNDKVSLVGPMISRQATVVLPAAQSSRQ